MTTDERSRRWLGALEGYYGPPLDAAERVALIGWLADHDYDAYAYSPKDDEYNRARWREPYPPAALDELRELAATCADAGLELVLSLSPGLDWRAEDPTEIDALVAKLSDFRDLGADRLCIAWDDVPGEGAEIGAVHGGAVAAAAERLDDPDVRWMTCPVDYALAEPTSYLRAFAAELPDAVEVLWTGPSVVTRQLDGADARGLEAAIGRRLVFGENYPVNDLGMAHVLHLGPYPPRAPDLVDATNGVLVNFMHRPVASRVGLASAARFWRDPTADRVSAWEAVIDEFDGLEPLARACRSWVAEPDPDPQLVGWADAALDGDARLADFLRAGCRTGLDADLAREVEPWLAQWEAEATAMLAALALLDADAVTVPQVWTAALTWQAARASRPQAFGIRFAMYPMTRRDDAERLVAADGAVVEGSNLTDRLWTAVLAAVLG